MRCPVCKAENDDGPSCRRCKADLSLLFEAERRRSSILLEAQARASRGDWTGFTEFAHRAHLLRADAQSCLYLALGHLMHRSYYQAWSYWNHWTCLKNGEER